MLGSFSSLQYRFLAGNQLDSGALTVGVDPQSLNTGD